MYCNLLTTLHGFINPSECLYIRWQRVFRIEENSMKKEVNKPEILIQPLDH